MHWLVRLLLLRERGKHLIDKFNVLVEHVRPLSSVEPLSVVFVFLGAAHYASLLFRLIVNLGECAGRKLR